MEKTFEFQDYLYKVETDTLLFKGESEFDDSISEEMDQAMTELGMYTEWIPVEWDTTYKTSQGEFTFTREELIKLILVFGNEKI